MRVWQKILSVVIALILIVFSFYFLYMRPRHVVPILMYHSIYDDPKSSLSVAPENFSKQMKFLAENEYSVITLDELVSGIESGRKFPGKTVVITFDDGMKDNYLNAFPALVENDFPATIFLITGYIDKFDSYVTWEQVRLMMREGISFGGHTRNNVYLPSVSDTKVLWDEIAGSKEDIKNKTGKPPEYFCYPTGGFNAKIKQAVKKAGYKGACTTNRGTDKSNKDVFELNRVKITDSDMNKPFHFRAKLSGYYNLFRKLKKPE